MNKKLYVGNLPFSVTDDLLKQHFAQAGNVVSAQVIIDKMSGRPRGFGFVEMASEDDAANAIKMFNGQQMDGRALTVNEAMPQRDNRTGGGGFRGNRNDSY
jgi:RNA recognition motif-containing protein